MPIYITENGKKILYKRIKKLENEIKAIREEKAVAYTLSGDSWHDNPGFNSLEQAEHRKVGEICDLNKKIDNAIICTTSVRNMSVVKVGSIIKCLRYVSSNDSENYFIWEIVGFGESDPANNKISYDSPIGSVLMNLSIGEESEAVFLPSENEEVTFEVIEFYSNWKDTKER